MTIRAGEIVAYRAWYVLDGVPRSTTVSGAILASHGRVRVVHRPGSGVRTMSPGVPWTDGRCSAARPPNQSECSCELLVEKLGRNRYPECRCGVHAWKQKVRARFHASGLASNRVWPFSTEVHWGAVALWGTVIEHEQGYRAEHARVLWHTRVDDRARIAEQERRP